MADQNEIEFKVKVTDEGLPKLADHLKAVDDAARGLGAGATTAGSRIDELSDAAGSAANQAEGLAQQAAVTTRGVDEAARSADRAAGEVQDLGNEMAATATKGAPLQTAMTAVGKAVAGLFALGKAKDFALDTIALADAYGQMAERIGMATPIAAEYDLVQQRILETANLTYRRLDEQQELYIRTADALRGMAYSTSEVLDITDSFSYLLTTNAASVERGQNAIDAYTKSIQSGKVEVDSWQSIMSAMPTIVNAVAQATGKTADEVRKLGITGKLSINDLNEGLRQTVELNKEAAAGMSATVADAVTRLTNTWTQYIGEANRANQSTEKIVKAIDMLSENLDTVVNVAVTAGEVMAAVWGVRALQALTSYIVSLKGATIATQALTAETLRAASAGDKLAMAGKLAAAGWIGWEIGTFLKDEFAVVEEAGIALAAGLTKAAERAQAAWEMAKAVFSDDTIEAAQQRLQVSLAKIDDEYAQLFANVGKGTPKVASDTKKVGDAAAQAADKVRVSASDMVEAWEAARIAKVGDAQAAEANLRVQLQLAQQSEEMALFMGNEYEARKAKILQMEIEIQLVEARVAISRAEAEGSIAVSQAKLAEMAASKEVDLVKQAELEASIKLAQAKLAEADATGKSTELLKSQLQLIRNGVGEVDNYGGRLRGLENAQASLTSSVNQANAALERQIGLINERYGSPLGSDKYARPKGGAVTGNTREERLAGQNAVDNTLAFRLRDMLDAGTIDQATPEEIRAVIAALEQNEAVNRDLDRMNPGAFSSAGMADRGLWNNVRTRLQQALGRSDVGQSSTSSGFDRAQGFGGSSKTVNVKIDGGRGRRETVSTDEAGAAALVRSLEQAASRSR